jgi:hypothetical protein
MTARYLACVRQWIQSLPGRQERRDLHADEARAIVSLRSPKFAVVLDELDKHWGQVMPEPLYTDEMVCSMLVQLEDSMFANTYIPKYSPFRIFNLDWTFDNTKRKNIPLAILGLEFTLSFYFPTTPINISNIRRLSINSWPVTGILPHPATKLIHQVLPRWISRLPNLTMIRLTDTKIQCLPSWFARNLKPLSIEASRSPCFIGDKDEYFQTPDLPKTLVGVTALKILDHIVNGGDWTDAAELPDHLVDKIMAGLPRYIGREEMLLGKCYIVQYRGYLAT